MAVGRSNELVAELEPTSSTSRDADLEIGIAEWNSGRSLQAIQRVRSLVERYPEAAGAHHALAWMLFQGSKSEEARPHARAAVDADAKEARHVALLATVELATRRVRQAESAATALAALAPGTAGPHELLGHAAASRAAWGAAARHFDRALELDEYARDIVVRRAEVHEREGKIREACEDLLRASKTEESLLSTHLATLVDRTLRLGHSAIAVTTFWGLTGVPGALFDVLELIVVTCLFMGAAIAFVWHRRRLRQIPPDAMKTYRKVRVVVHVFVALLSSLIVLFVVGIVLGRLIPKGVDSAVTGTIIIASSVLVTVVGVVVPYVWRTMRGLPVKRATLLAF
jgi:tetratricopeptide (TPR) repeat protein